MGRSASPVMRGAGLLSRLSCHSGKRVPVPLRHRMRPLRHLRRSLWPRLATDQRKGRCLPRKAHLLLVDDDPNTLASLSRAFRLAGDEATLCGHAPRALGLLRTEAFDLILSDVVMPGKSGIELLEDLKHAGVKTPIVLISGQANVEMAVKSTKLVPLELLEKPLSTEKLLVAVENALRLTRLEDENRDLRHRLGKHELVGA